MQGVTLPDTPTTIIVVVAYGFVVAADHQMLERGLERACVLADPVQLEETYYTSSRD